MTMIRRLNSQDKGFAEALKNLLAFDAAADEHIVSSVRDIVKDVRQRGDAAVLAYTKRFDRLDATTVTELEIDQAQLQQALDNLPVAQREALQEAANRVRYYHEQQKLEDWFIEEADGSRLGQQVRAIDRVGLYVPGGLASYPSSVLMNAIPAKVAGVAELIMVVPTPDGIKNQLVLAAAALTGVSKVLSIGGAQAVAALAYGTDSIPAVDKIVGPGNAYVAEAKRQVFGVVGIDMVAGPSEVLIITDGSANPEWVAMDMFAQAEHDEMAQAIVLCPDAGFLDRLEIKIAELLPERLRKDIIRKSITNRGALIKVSDLQEACRIANIIAPEHLELALENATALLPEIRHAGAIFVGHWSVEALGDYCAGPNHVLPTLRGARFSSPLGVYDFQKRSSVIHMSAVGAQRLAGVASILGRGEGLEAHARSAELRGEVSPKYYS